MRRQHLEKLKHSDRNKTILTVLLLVIDELQCFFENTRLSKINENDILNISLK